MLFGLDGVEVGLLIVFLSLFAGILSGFPVAFAIPGAGLFAFAIIAYLDASGVLIHHAVDTGSEAYRALTAAGVHPDTISHFRYPDLPLIAQPVFERGWEVAMDRNISFIVNRMNERVFAGQSIETLLAVLMFVMMGITLERSKIANDLLTTMARVFGPLPGGLAVAVVVVGAFLAASTGIVGATVVTMGLLSLPTMLRAGYSPELSTGVIAASGTLGQIIPPSIVLVLLGTLSGDLYSAAQEARAQSFGCSDALTYLGKPAVVSVGTLFQSAMLPGILLAVLYAGYAFLYALVRPQHAPAVHSTGHTRHEVITRGEALTWFFAVPAILIVGTVVLSQVGLVGSQDLTVSNFAQGSEGTVLRTNVSEACKAAMIDLHGQAKWDLAVAQQAAIEASGGAIEGHALSAEEIQAAIAAKAASAAPIGSGIATIIVLLGLVLAVARGVRPADDGRPLLIGGLALAVMAALDVLFIHPAMSSGATLLIIAIPLVVALWACKHAARRLATNELIRVIFPPLVLIVAVLGSILGGITNPTPAAALGAGGAILLAAFRKLKDEGRDPWVITWTTFALVALILLGANFDLRINQAVVTVESYLAYIAAAICFMFACFGLGYAGWVLLRTSVLGKIVRETAKVTSMVFTILVGSQLLNLVVISFGGEHYIQDFLRAFDSEFQVFLIVMIVLFVLGFVLDFLEIIYIVIPIVGPVIYGGTFDPKWVTIMIAVNLQTSFLTPPFGFALFYLRGVAPASVTTGHIYRGIVPFVLIQVAGLAVLWFVPSIVTVVPDLLGR